MRTVSSLLGVGEGFAVGEGDVKLGVLAVEGVLQAIEVAGTFPLAHGEVVEEVVATGLGTCGGNFRLGEDPLETGDGQLTHVLYGVGAGHDDVHAGETAHGTYVHHIVFHLAVAEPRGHEVLQTVHGGGSNGGLFVGFGDAEVVGGEAFVLAGDIDAGLQLRMINRKTLYDFHWLKN